MKLKECTFILTETIYVMKYVAWLYYIYKLWIYTLIYTARECIYMPKITCFNASLNGVFYSNNSRQFNVYPMFKYSIKCFSRGFSSQPLSYHRKSRFLSRLWATCEYHIFANSVRFNLLFSVVDHCPLS